MPEISLTPDEKLIVNDAILSGKDAINVLNDLFEGTKRYEVKKAIRDEIIHFKTHPVDLVDKLKKTPVETKGPAEWLSYRLKRIPQVFEEEIKGVKKEFKEARYAPMMQSWKYIFPALRALNIPFAPVRALAGEPVEELAREKGAPEWLSRIIGYVPEIAATWGAGALLKTAKVPRLLGIGRKAEEVIGPSYEVHKTMTEVPLAETIWKSIVEKTETLKKLAPQQRKLWREAFREKVGNYFDDFNLALSEGDFNRATASAKALKGNLESLLVEHPEFTKKIPIFSAEELESMVKTIHGAPKTLFEKKEIVDALADVVIKGRVPEKHHLKALQEILGFDISSLAKKGFLADLISFPRAIMASTDLSGIFRQGIMAVGRPQFWKAIPKYVKSFSRKNYETLMESIMTDNYFIKARKAGLGLTDILTGSEEMFVSKLRPIGIGWLIEASERGYQGFLNKLRFDLFKDMARKLEKLGYNIEENPEKFRQLADYIGALTGRGPLRGRLGRAATMSDTFFAPRLIASRVYFLNPKNLIALPRELRLEGLRDILSVSAFGSGVLGLAYLNGAKIERDPRNADFLKARFGDTRIDPWGGFLPYVVLLSRLVSGKVVSSTSGKEFEIGEGINKIGYDEMMYRFLEGKYAPIPSFLWHWFKGTDFAGQPFDVIKETYTRLIPLTIQDTMDIIDIEPTDLWAVPFSVTGFGVQTYMANTYYKDIDIPKEIRNKVDNGLLEVKLNLPIRRTLHGFPLSVDESEAMKQVFGKEIYGRLYNLFSDKSYQSLPDIAKEKVVKSIITQTADYVATKYFPHKKYFHDLTEMIQFAYRWDKKKAQDYVDKLMKRYERQLRGTLD